jgi:predicted kinase
MTKEVELFIGVPCSGKSTHLQSNYQKDEVFVVSRDDIRDDIIKGTEYVYSDFFAIPHKGDADNEKYGHIRKNGAWSKVETLNTILYEKFKKRVERAVYKVESGTKVVIDLLNMTRKERDEVKSWFKEVDGVKFSAVVFDYENNLETIKNQIHKRGKLENKVIPFNIVEKIIEISDPVNFDEFSSIKYVDGLAQLKKENALILENAPKKPKRTNRVRRNFG